MVRRPPTRSSVLIAILLLLAFVVWTWLTFNSAAFLAFDQRTVAPQLDPDSNTAEIAAAFALLTWPGLEYAALAAIALWAFRRRLRQLAVALVLVIIFGWGGADLLKIIFQRPRPEQALDLLTATGYAYPSGHMTSVMALSIAVGATFAVTRQTFRARVLWQVGSGLLILAVAFDRWITGAHYITDIVGGALFGALAATAALLAAGVTVPIPHELVGEIVRSRAVADEPPVAPLRRAAVIFNPAKVTDWITFRRHVDYELKIRGWDRALWLETTSEDPGHAHDRTSRTRERRPGARCRWRRHHSGDLLRTGPHRHPVRPDPGRHRESAGPQHRHTAGRGGGSRRCVRWRRQGG